MRYAILFCSIALIIGSCTGKKGKDSSIAKQDTTFLPINYEYKKLEGVYSGEFGGSDIHISLRHVNGRRAVGYSLHKGLKRNFSGSMKLEGAGFRFKLSEPGNNQYDGIFDFLLDTVSFNIKGSWTPNDLKNLTAKNYSLVRIYDTAEQFSPVFNDSLGGLNFNSDGLCSYETYQKENVENQPPPVTARGNWTKKGEELIIDWEPNTIFPSRHSTFKIEKDTAGDLGGARYIMLEGRKLYTQEY